MAYTWNKKSQAGKIFAENFPTEVVYPREFVFRLQYTRSTTCVIFFPLLLVLHDKPVHDPNEAVCSHSLD